MDCWHPHAPFEPFYKQSWCLTSALLFTGLSTADLSTLARALGEIQFAPPAAWVQSYLSAVQQLLPSFLPSQLPDMAWGLSRVRVEPNTEWGRAFLQVSTACSQG